VIQRLHQTLHRYFRYWWSKLGHQRKGVSVKRTVYSRPKKHRSKRHRYFALGHAGPPQKRPPPSAITDPTAERITYTVPRTEVVHRLNQTLARTSREAHTENATADSKYQRAHRRSLKSLADSAYLCECQSRDDKAEQLYKQAIALSIQQFGEHHLTVATHLTDLATFYRLRGRYKQAIPLLSSALKIRQQGQLISHPDVGETFYQLAVSFCQLQDYRQAEPLFQSALNIFRQAFGRQHTRTQTAYCDFMRMIAIAIESGKFEEINIDPPPLNLDRLSDIYSWARPHWMPPSSKDGKQQLGPVTQVFGSSFWRSLS